MTVINSARISFRIGPRLWMPDERFGALIELIKKYENVTDEITFFTSDTHSPLKPDDMHKRADVLHDRMRLVKKEGYSSGINILSTIGHHCENLLNSLSGGFTYMTDINGDICHGSLCPNDENVRGYVGSIYEIAAAADPDYIWIDDDVRLLGHLPIMYGCFCDRCLAIFEKEYGIKFTRESIKKSFNSSPADDKLHMRKAWLQHNRNTVSNLLALIENTVHNVKPDMPLGFMTGERYFEGYDFGNWADILAGPDSAEVMWRPGGGFYSDEKMKDLIGKSHEIGRQVSLLPDAVCSIQSEIENFPYQVLKKSVKTTSLEAASHIAAGCIGAAFNVLPFGYEPLPEYESMVVGLSKTRPFYDLLVETFDRTQPEGIYTGWAKDSFVTNNLKNGDWLSGYLPVNYADELLEIGLPAAYSHKCAQVITITGDMILALGRDMIISILSSGVYMDAGALANLNKLGYGGLTGFCVERIVNEDCIEEYTKHGMQGKIAGEIRDGRQSFYKYPVAVLKPFEKEARVLSRIINYGGREIGACGMGLFENELGGRICACGYYPWSFLQNLSKSTQMKFVMRWLSKDRLHAYVESLHKINIWARQLKDGSIALALINANLDHADDISLLVRTEKKTIAVFDMQCRKSAIASCETDGIYTKFRLPDIGAWDMRLVIA